MYATRMFRISNMKLPLFKRLRAKQKEEGDKAFGAFSKKYQMSDTVLGTGSYSEVRLARNKHNGKQVAVKIIDKTGLSERELSGLQKEVNILKTLRHKNVVHFYDSYEEDDTMYVVMEYIPGGELFTRIVADEEPFTEGDVKRIIRTLGEALKHCKERGVIHRDIKPQNLLLTSKGRDAELKLADFNLSIKIDPEAQNFSILQTMCGTPNYVAPEILTNKPYDFKCDIWSLGVITYLLLSGGYLPFFVEEEGEEGKELLLQKVKRGRWSFYPPEAWTNVSDNAKNFLLGTMERNPERRFDYETLLNHEWLKGSETETKFEPINFESNHYGYYRRKMHMISKVILAVEEFKEIMEEKEPLKKNNIGQSSNNEFDSFLDLMN